MRTEQALSGHFGGGGSIHSSSSSGSLPSQVYQARLSPRGTGRPISNGSDQYSSKLTYEPNVQTLQSQQQRFGGSGDRLGGVSGHQFKRDSDRYSTGSTGSGDYPPPPLPPPPSRDVIAEATAGYTNDEPLYEPQNIVHMSRYNQDMKPQVQHSNPSNPGGVGYMSSQSTLGANLNELDYLLQDLNSAQFMEEISRSGSDNSVNISSNPRLPPATLPKPLSKSSPRSPGPVMALHTSFSPGNSPGQSSQSASVHASSATRELEDLMDSLSQFKINTSTTPPVQTDEPSYAKVDKTPSNPTSPTAISDLVDSTSPPAQSAPPSELDNMLGSLESDMRGHGVSVSTKGLCGACAKPIVGQVITALGRIWHPEHFCCHSCDEELGTRSFFERDEMPYCEPCYHRLFAPLCGKCKTPILDKCVTAMDSTWHMECFACEHCGRMLNDEGFHERDGRPYCRNDYFEIFAPKCGGCNLPIIEDFISTLNTHWHPQCFRCMECGVALAGGSFYDHDGLPYCETHYYAKRGSLCAGCQKPITGRCITAMSRKFHPEHFTCAFCLKQLNKGTFKEQNDKPYCHPCFVKLFG